MIAVAYRADLHLAAASLIFLFAAIGICLWQKQPSRLTLLVLSATHWLFVRDLFRAPDPSQSTLAMATQRFGLESLVKPIFYPVIGFGLFSLIAFVLLRLTHRFISLRKSAGLWLSLPLALCVGGAFLLQGPFALFAWAFILVWMKLYWYFAYALRRGQPNMAPFIILPFWTASEIPVPGHTLPLQTTQTSVFSGVRLIGVGILLKVLSGFAEYLVHGHRPPLWSVLHLPHLNIPDISHVGFAQFNALLLPLWAKWLVVLTSFIRFTCGDVLFTFSFAVGLARIVGQPLRCPFAFPRGAQTLAQFFRRLFYYHFRLYLSLLFSPVYRTVKHFTSSPAVLKMATYLVSTSIASIAVSFVSSPEWLFLYSAKELTTVGLVAGTWGLAFGSLAYLSEYKWRRFHLLKVALLVLICALMVTLMTGFPKGQWQDRVAFIATLIQPALGGMDVR